MEEIDIDGYMCPKTGIEYLGKARKQDGEWRCLANVEGSLCLVVVKLSPDPSSHLWMALK
jgi:hypothetical protein